MDGPTPEIGRLARETGECRTEVQRFHLQGSEVAALQTATRLLQDERLAWLQTDNELLRRHLDTAQEDAASWRSVAESWRGTVERSAGVGERERELYCRQ